MEWNEYFAYLFVYDGLGRLRKVADIEWTWFEGEWLPYTAWETRYIYDGMQVIQERDPYNTPAVSYTRGNDLSGTLEGAGGIGGLLARSHGYSGGNWSTHSYYHADGNGNITFMLSSSQAMVARYRYDPFGNKVSSSGSLAIANVYRFSSKLLHGPTGLYYYGYRWYDPSLQRWVNRDPIGEAGGENLYEFALNNPFLWVDKFGEDVYPREQVETGINPQRDPIITQQLDLGCNGLTMVYQQSGCPNRNVNTAPENAKNTKCFLAEEEARSYECPEGKKPFIFAKQGKWEKPPTPAPDGAVPNNSINSAHFNYITCLPGGKWKYAWMDHGIRYGPQNVQCENYPRPTDRKYPNEIWCVTCKCP